MLEGSHQPPILSLVGFFCFRDSSFFFGQAVFSIPLGPGTLLQQQKPQQAVRQAALPGTERQRQSAKLAPGLFKPLPEKQSWQQPNGVGRPLPSRKALEAT